LIAGIGLGLGLAAWWPHEPAAYAETAVAADKFAMCTVQTAAGSPEAIFVLDYATGRLSGAAFNNSINQISQPMFRLLAKDFGLSKPGQYAMVSGYVGLQSRGGQPGSGGIYVAELTTGKLMLYGFINAPQGTTQVQELSVISGPFQWRSN
jgi:hypothetical protein